MLWAAILLADPELVSMTVAMLFVEQGNERGVFTPEQARELIAAKGSELLALAPTPAFEDVLAEKVSQVVGNIC